jgi:hypothetical protein
MNTTLSPIRRIGAGLVIAGIATFGSVTVAPAASAASLDGPDKVVQSDDGKGPDAFIELEHGRFPVFFCEDTSKDDKGKAKDEKGNAKADKEKDTKHANKCVDVSVGGPRF